MKKISTFILRDNLSKLIDDVYENNNSLIIERYNKPVAMIVPIPQAQTESNHTDKFFGFMKDADKNMESGIDFENRVRRSKKEAERIVDLRNRT